jgi:hypothetical protein
MHKHFAIVHVHCTTGNDYDVYSYSTVGSSLATYCEVGHLGKVEKMFSQRFYSAGGEFNHTHVPHK